MTISIAKFEEVMTREEAEDLKDKIKRDGGAAWITVGGPNKYQVCTIYRGGISEFATPEEWDRLRKQVGVS